MSLFFLDALVSGFAEKHCIRGHFKGSYIFYDTLLYGCILTLLFLKDVITGEIPFLRFLLLLAASTGAMFLWALFTSRFVSETPRPKD